MKGVCSICQSVHGVRVMSDLEQVNEYGDLQGDRIVMDAHHQAGVLGSDCRDMIHCYHYKCEGEGTIPQFLTK